MSNVNVDLFAQGADESARQAKSGGGNFDKVNYLSLDDGEKAYVRFLIDARPFVDEAGNNRPGWIVVQQHSFVKTKPKPERKADGKPYEGGWPATMGAVCRKTILPGAGGKTIAEFLGDGLDDGCFICDQMRKPDGKPHNSNGKTWALAVLREPVLGDGSEALGGEAKKGKVIGYRDKTRQVTRTAPDGTETTTEEKAVVVVNQADTNFFTTLKDYADEFETVLNLDFIVTRKGTGKETDYAIVAIPNSIGVIDFRTPGLIEERYPNLPDIAAIVMEQAGQDYYTRFFDTRVENLPGKKPESDQEAAPSEGGAPASQQVKPDTDAPVGTDEATANDIAARVRAYSPGGGASDSTSPEPEAQPDPSPTEIADAAPAADGGMRDFG